MRVKRYVVDSMPDALQKIRADLGKDAVILNTKEIRSGGFLGMFSKKKIEVIAATDAAAQTNTKPATAASRVQNAKPNFVPPAAPQTPIGAYKNANSFTNGNTAKAENEEPAFPEVPDVLTDLLGAKQQAAASAVIEKTTPIKSAVEQAREDAVLEELKQMKSYMQKLSAQSFSQLPPDPVIERLKQRLIEQELEPQFVDDICLKVAEEASSRGEAVTEAQAWSLAKEQLLDCFPETSCKSIEPDTKVVHFVGPTGVGKTTTIAKLAAEQVLKYHRKVGFITSDTYRIAAVEQLKTYATILNVPLEVVFSPQDLPKAFDQLQDRDIIFMDTAGRNFRNEMYVSELNSLLHTSGKSETFLVLSLTTKYKDMKAIADNFSRFKLDKVLFTKMDETESFGAVVNLARDFKLQLSYVTNGQSVPDDISVLSEQHIVDRLLEG